MQLRGLSRRLGLVAFATTLAGLGLFAIPAQAMPEDTRILAYRMPCGSAVCSDEGDRLTGDEVSDGNVQLQAKTSSAIGLTSVEIQLQEDGEWRCLTRWTTSARSGTWQKNIDLSARNDGCNGSTLTWGRNGTYRVRTLASDRSGSQASVPLTLQVSEAPTPPQWAGSPTRVSEDAGSPSVRLSWHANPEPDVVEYHFLRDDGRNISEYAISASRPGAQGCTLENGIYSCVDDDFPASGYSGTYRYALVAYRSSPDDRSSCSLPGSGSCVRSANSGTQSLALRQPPPPPDDRPQSDDGTGSRPDPNDTGSVGDGGDSNGAAGPGRGDGGGGGARFPSMRDLIDANFDFEGGAYDLELPFEVEPGSDQPLAAPGAELGAFEEQQRVAFGDPSQEGRQRGFTALALGLVFLVVAVHLARVLKAPVTGPRP